MSKPILHHYTSGAGVLGIFESDSIWATRIQYMNDAKEFLHAIEIAEEHLRKIGHESDDELRKKFCDAVPDNLNRADQLTIYVVCFSEIEDSLSQWRGYCPPSFGYSLGFVGDKLEIVGKNQGFILKPCIYESVEQGNIVKRWAEQTVEYLIARYSDSEDFTEFCRRQSGHILETFIQFAPFLKHSSFQDEREWRLVSVIPTDDSRTELRPGKSTLVPYVKVKLGLSSDQGPLWNLRVGATPHKDLAMNAITVMFNKVHFRNGIAASETPYRDW